METKPKGAQPKPRPSQIRKLLPVRRLLRRIHNLMRPVHMPNGPVPQPARLWHILGLGEGVMRRQQQFVRLAEPVMRAQVGIDAERIIQPLSIVDRCLLSAFDSKVAGPQSAASPTQTQPRCSPSPCD